MIVKKWVKDILNVDKFRNDDPIPRVKTKEEWVAATGDKKPVWCFTKNTALSGKKHQKLYNWYAVNDPRGLAPDGFQIPSADDWKEALEYEGGDDETSIWMESLNFRKKKFDKTEKAVFSVLKGNYPGNLSDFGFIGMGGFWYNSKNKSTMLSLAPFPVLLKWPSQEA